MRAFVLSAVAAAGLVTLAAAPAAAQFGIHVGPGGAGVYVDPTPGYGPGPDHYDDWRVTRREAIRIARRNGMREIYDVDRTRNHWIVRGENWRGRRVSMRIDRHGGWSW